MAGREDAPPARRTARFLRPHLSPRATASPLSPCFQVPFGQLWRPGRNIVIAVLTLGLRFPVPQIGAGANVRPNTVREKINGITAIVVVIAPRQRSLHCPQKLRNSPAFTAAVQQLIGAEPCTALSRRPALCPKAYLSGDITHMTAYPPTQKLLSSTRD